MDLSKLATLKQKMNEAKEFKEVWEYFLDHLGEDPAFLDLGEPAEDRHLVAAIEEAGRALFRRPARLSHSCFRRIAEYDFLHGSAILEGCPTSVLYFQDSLKGMLGVLGATGRRETTFVRFTTRALYEGLGRSPN